MPKLLTNKPEWESELKEELMQFFPDDDSATVVEYRFDPSNATHEVFIDGVPYPLTKPITDAPRSVNLDKRNAKLAVYAALSAFTGRTLPWGSLTGIRPTRLLYELLSYGKSVQEAQDILVESYGVSREKTELLKRIIAMQDGVIVRDDNVCSLYVHIPFCTSRCTYCSFVTEVVEKKASLVKPYVDRLVQELDAARQFFTARNIRVDSVYIGGGTPTALDADDLYRVCRAAAYPVEFTCEAGRPDTITREKLDAMQACNVTRISINPQSLVEKTLRAIGRNHTARQFFDAYSLALQYGFSINTDLIAGLEQETIDEFRYTLDTIGELRPDNITVHTLARKNGAALKETQAYTPNTDIERMTDYAYSALTKIGYAPYYLYRQKRMLGNLENVGYTLPNARCKNNITTMEECTSVFACGAGAISKRVYAAENKNVRLANIRDVKLYLESFEARLQKKHEFFS